MIAVLQMTRINPQMRVSSSALSRNSSTRCSLLIFLNASCNFNRENERSDKVFSPKNNDNGINTQSNKIDQPTSSTNKSPNQTLFLDDKLYQNPIPVKGYLRFHAFFEHLAHLYRQSPDYARVHG